MKHGLMKWIVVQVVLGHVMVQVLSAVDPRCRNYYPSEVAEIEGDISREKDIFGDGDGGFPLCLDKTDNVLKDFRDVLNKYDDKTKTIPLTTDDGSPLSVNLYEIRVKDPSVFNMRNWLRLSIEKKNIASAKKIKELIVQGITSPLGLPYLEFRPDTICPESRSLFDPPANSEIAVPCKYRPKSAIRYFQLWFDRMAVMETGPNCYAQEISYIICKTMNIFQHPNVYVLKRLTGSYNKVQVNFNWIDVMCHEVTAVQFNILVRFEDEAVEAYLSQVFLFGKDSKVGIPYPWHASLETKADCTSNVNYICDASVLGRTTDGKNNLIKYGQQCTWGNTFPVLPPSYTSLHGQKLRIIYNKEYDDCIRSGINLSILPDGSNECPPGPFFCKKDRAEAAQYNRVTSGVKDIPGIALEDTAEAYRTAVSKSWAKCPYNKNGDGDCARILTKELEEKCTQIFSHMKRAIKPLVDSTEGVRHKLSRTAVAAFEPNTTYAYAILTSLTVSQRVIDRSEHGALMIAAFFVVMAGSNFLARFFKETGGKTEETENGCCGYRCWLLFHMALSFISLYLIWMSLAMPMDTLHCQHTNEYDITQCVQNPHPNVTIHKYFGYLVILYAHVNFVFGWIRPLNRKIRNLFTAIHSVSGHILQFFVLIVIFFTKVCNDVLLFVVGLICLGLFLSGVATYLQLKADKNTNLTPKRKHFPIVEHVMSQDCKIGFIVQLWIHWIGHVIIYMLILFSYKIYIHGGKCWLSSGTINS